MELFHKNLSELKALLPLIASHQHLITGLNITNKNANDDLISQVQVIREHLNSTPICIHVSIKYQHRRDADQTLQRISKLITQLAAFENCSILLVSGSGKKKTLDTISALSRLHATGLLQGKRSDIPIYVAYNPYFPDRNAQREENERLRRKLSLHPGAIAGIYLQMGTDTKALEAGLRYIDSAVAHTKELLQCSTSAQDYQPVIYGSIFLPTRQLLAQMKFRPWNGVFLSSEYLADLGTAENMTSELLGVYLKRGVTPVVESAIKTPEQMSRVGRLLAMAQARSLHP